MTRNEALEILAQCALSSFVSNVAQPRLRAALEVYFAQFLGRSPTEKKNCWTPGCNRSGGRHNDRIGERRSR